MIVEDALRILTHQPIADLLLHGRLTLRRLGRGNGSLRGSCCLLHGDADHRDRGERAVLARGDESDRVDNLHTLDDLPEDGVLALRARVEPVQEVVVHHVHEELAATCVRASVGHGQRAPLVADPRGVLVHDGAAALAVVAAGHDLAREEVPELEAWLGPARAGAAGPGVTRERAAELCHELRDHAVEVQAVIEARGSQVQEVAGRQRHLLQEDLRHDVPHRRAEYHLRV
mmetsp:Transcript_72175/g.218320  ORF Transcript_72175/g.218320 Transcript_72175/m.218320 type:complete len:230 (+) Transcript_72175:1499-2188(+)